jgi:hypothetical protein
VETDLKEKITVGMMKSYGLDEVGIQNNTVLEISPLILTMAVDPRYKNLTVLKNNIATKTNS